MRLRFSIRAKPGEALMGAAGLGAPVIERAVEVPFASGEAVIGRGQGATIALPFPAISLQHARIFREGGEYRIEDLGSANGTLLGQRRLVPHVAEAIALGDVVDFAGIELRFDGELSEDRPSPAQEGTATLARRLVHDIFEACPPAECARLVAVAGPALGRELALSACGRVFKLGRGEQCDLAIPDGDISREHAAFERGANGIVVRDLGSKNGVEVGGQRVAGTRILRDGEIVCLGETRLRVVDPEERYLSQVEKGDVRPRTTLDSFVDPRSGGAYRTGQDAALPEPVPLAASPLAAMNQQAEIAPSRSHLPLVTTAIAITALFLALGVVLALAFAA
jgi:pSer/pThr/pTyr-binding forkhead associated (FHA) protein